MILATCQHETRKKHGKDRKGNPRWRCLLCGQTWTEQQPKLLGDMRISVDDAKRVCQLLVEGMSIRATERTTRINRNTICKLIGVFGNACQRYMDSQMRGLKLSHLEFDEQWTFVRKKQSRLTMTEREECHDQGDIYLWTCIDKKTKLLPSFLIGKRSADNARRFMMDVAGRLVFPAAHASDNHAFKLGSYPIVCQLSTDGFAAYPEAVDLAFGPYVKYGTIIKEYKNANMPYTPSEMVGTKRTARQGIGENEISTICTSHVERHNLTVRTFMKRFTRLALGFSKKLENLESAVALHMAYYNFCWRPGKMRITPAMAAGVTDRLWIFDELLS